MLNSFNASPFVSKVSSSSVSVQRTHDNGQNIRAMHSLFAGLSEGSRLTSERVDELIKALTCRTGLGKSSYLKGHHCPDYVDQSTFNSLLSLHREAHDASYSIISLLKIIAFIAEKGRSAFSTASTSRFNQQHATAYALNYGKLENYVHAFDDHFGHLTTTPGMIPQVYYLVYDHNVDNSVVSFHLGFREPFDLKLFQAPFAEQVDGAAFLGTLLASGPDGMCLLRKTDDYASYEVEGFWMDGTLQGIATTTIAPHAPLHGRLMTCVLEMDNTQGDGILTVIDGNEQQVLLVGRNGDKLSLEKSYSRQNGEFFTFCEQLIAHINRYQIVSYAKSGNIDFFPLRATLPRVNANHFLGSVNLSQLPVVDQRLRPASFQLDTQTQTVEQKIASYESKYNKGVEKGYADEMTRLIYTVGTFFSSRTDAIDSRQVCELMGIDPHANFTLTTAQHDVNNLTESDEIKGFVDGYQMGASKARVATTANMLNYNKWATATATIPTALLELIGLTTEEFDQASDLAADQLANTDEISTQRQVSP